MTSRSSGIPPGAVRSAFAFSGLFLVNAAALAWLPVWLESRGLSGEAVGVVVATIMVARFVFAPAGGYAADALGRPRAVLTVTALALVAAFVFFPLAGPLYVFVAIAFLMGAGLGPSVPILESTTVRLAQEGGAAFGPVRAIGTMAFIVGTLALGGIVGRFGEGAIIVWLIATGGLWALGTALLPLPRAAKERSERRGPRPGMLRALASRGVLLALLASALIQGAHAFYYGFGSLAWRDQGLSEATIGALWAWGAGVEVALLWYARRFERLGGPLLMAIGAVCALVRWTAMGFAPGLGWLIGLQMLHAGSFGAAHLGFILYIRDHAPPHASATAQAVNSALTFGGVLAGATAVSGVLYEHGGAHGYWSMSLLAGAGLAAALALRGLRPPGEPDRAAL